MLGTVRVIVSLLTPCQVRAKHRQLSAAIIEEVNANGIHSYAAVDRIDTLAWHSEALIEHGLRARTPKRSRPWKKRVAAKPLKATREDTLTVTPNQNE